MGLYGGLSSTAPRLYELARFYREKNITTIAGGQHFIGENIKEALDNGVDFVVVGEGEDTVRELLTTIREGRNPDQVAGLAFMRHGQVVKTAARTDITNFDRLPLPEFELVRYAKIKLYPVSWVRGCGMDCEFCTVKGKQRASSVERVVEQISSLLEKHGVRRFRSFIKKARLDTIQIMLPVPLPGTALTDRLAADNRIFPREYVGWEYYDGNFPLFTPDDPLTPGDMHAAIGRIMGRFYTFVYLFAIARNILTFPAMILSLWNIRYGWHIWHRVWRNDLLRFGGWIVIRRWRSDFKKGTFKNKLAREQQNPRGPAQQSDAPINLPTR